MGSLDLKALVRLARPQQYSKNALVFGAPLAAGRLTELDVFVPTMLGFLVFCFVSSIGYVTNDLADVERDKAHPRKRLRPLPSGRVTRRQAQALMAGLAAACAALLFALPVGFAICTLGYLVLTVVYTHVLKPIPWIELAAIAAGFLLRALAGAVASDVDASAWFLMVIAAAASLTIIGKRLAELLALGPESETRAVLASYTPEALRGVAIATALGAVVAYGMWASGSAKIGDRTMLMITVVPFVLALGRWLQLALRGAAEVPELLVFRDKPTLIAGTLWAALFFLGVYA